MNVPSPTLAPRASRIQRVRHELRQREVEVLRTERLGPNFVAVTFGGSTLEGFRSDSFDDHVKFLFAGAAWHPMRRDYTPRRFDPVQRELTIEFAVHAQGAASDWARQARPGMAAAVAGPRGSMIIPTDFDWHLLLGDASALPAIHRRLEELPASTRAIVAVQLDDVADQRALQSRAALDLYWLTPQDDLATWLTRLPLPAGEGFAWCAGEAGAMARVRDVLLRDKEHPQAASRVAAYWKRGSSDHHERLAG